MKSREVLRMLKRDGWVEQPQGHGAHPAYSKHPIKSGKVMVADHKGDLTLDEIKSIERQSGLKLRGR